MRERNGGQYIAEASVVSFRWGNKGVIVNVNKYNRMAKWEMPPNNLLKSEERV